MTGARFDPLTIAPGERIGPYEIVRLEAEGGHGFLYRVQRDGRAYALKIGRYDLASQYPDDRERDEERLDREIAAMKTLRHPNIVRVLAFDRWPDLEGGYPYLVMEYVEGQRLDDWQAGTAPSLARLTEIYERIALAIAYMHSHDIFHRDLKAQNVVVRPDGEPVVLDFGLARPRYAHEVTRAGVIGTATHYAPEYVKWCDSAASLTEPFVWQAATDLHAFGYMLYVALTGRSPYATDERSRPSTDTELLLAIKKIVPRRASAWNPRVPAALDDLVASLLAKEPGERPKGAVDVAAVLRQAREAAGTGDKAWTDPFDLPRGRRGSAPSRPEPQAAAAEAGGPPAADGDGGSPPAEVELIRGSGKAVARGIDLPAPPPPATFVDDAEGRPPTAHERAADPVAETLASMKAQLGEPRTSRRLGRTALGATAIAATLLLIYLTGLLQPSTPAGPKTLLSVADPASLPPLSGVELQGAPVPAGSPGGAESSSGAVPDLGAPAGRSDLATTGAEHVGPREVPPLGIDASPRIEPAYAPVPMPTRREPEPAPVLRSRPLGDGDDPLLRSRSVPAPAPASPAIARPRGVPYGSHVRARLLSNLDTRTIGSGPVEAVLDVPHVVRGEIVLPVRTMAYGTASETSGRFTIRFTRLRLPDDTELAFEAIALARDDGKPGLAAARRVERPREEREGVAARIAKGTGNLLLDTVAGGIPEALARNAGRTVLNQEPTAEVTPGGQWALLLDSGVVFDLWVERAF